MSDTTRWIQPGWNYPLALSKKHQSRDHRSLVYRPKFTHFLKNTRYNFLKKISQLRLKEMINDY